MTASRRDHLVVILSYGDPGRAVRCATSCLADGTADLLVVVNPVSPGLPADRALTELVAREQQVDLLALPENRGFTGGMNAGLHWGRRRGYGILTVLNDDTTAGPGVLSRLGDDVRANPAAAIAPRIDYADRPGQPWSLGVTIDPDDLLPRHLSESEFAALPRRDDGLVAVPMFTGCCICAGTDVWDRVGDFDDDYFLYFEDSDWSQRARQLGVPLLIDDAAVLTHEVSASSQGAHLTGYYYARNLLRYATVWHASGTVALRMYTRRSLRPALRTARHEGPAESARRTLVSVAGATAFAIRHRGPAGPVLTRVIGALDGRERHRDE